jgi:hypothetical protein
MTLDHDPLSDPPARSRGAKRHRTRQLAVRCTPEELEAIQAKADKAGLATGAFARAAMLDSPGPRAQRRAPADKEALLRILGHLGRVGSNINQIARRLNLGEKAQLPGLEEALGAYLELRNAIFEALGLDPKTRPPSAPKPETRSPHGHKGRQPRGA